VQEAVRGGALEAVRRGLAGGADDPVGVVDQDALVLEHQVVLAAGPYAKVGVRGLQVADSLGAVVTLILS